MNTKKQRPILVRDMVSRDDMLATAISAFVVGVVFGGWLLMGVGQ